MYRVYYRIGFASYTPHAGFFDVEAAGHEAAAAAVEGRIAGAHAYRIKAL